MICKRIRLSERRMKPLPEMRDGPIIRPCTNTLVNTTSSTSPRGKRTTVQDPPNEEQTEVSGENTDSTFTLPPSNNLQPKTPLIVLTLSMPPETETLAPKLIKRDPRKQPSFCIQYLTQSKLLNDNKRLFEPQLPEIYIQGVELIEPKIEDRETLLTDRSFSNRSSDVQPIINNPSDHQNATIDFFSCDREFLLNFDGYDLDINGGLPGDTRTPTPTPNGITSWCVRRTPSPTTRQVIRVDVSLNKKNMKKKFDKL